MDQYLFNSFFSGYDDEDRILSKSQIDEIADDLSKEITEQIDKQFAAVSKSLK